MSDASPCGCEQSLSLQSELATARVRISNLEFQNSNLRARLDAASPPLPPTTPPPMAMAMAPLASISVLDTPAGRMAAIAELASPTPFVDADTGEAREWPAIISTETAVELLDAPAPVACPDCGSPDGAVWCVPCHGLPF